MPFITELPQLPEILKTQLNLITDKTLSTIKKIKDGNYIPNIYTNEQINKVKRYVQYLDTNRFNNMSDFSKITRCLHNISGDLIDVWMEKCKLSILWNKDTSYGWCINFFNISNYKSVGLGSFYHYFKIDNPEKYNEFLKVNF